MKVEDMERVLNILRVFTKERDDTVVVVVVKANRCKTLNRIIVIKPNEKIEHFGEWSNCQVQLTACFDLREAMEEIPEAPNRIFKSYPATTGHC